MYLLLAIIIVTAAVFVILLVSLFAASRIVRLQSADGAAITHVAARMAVAVSGLAVLYAAFKNFTSRYVGEWDLLWWMVKGLIGALVLFVLALLPFWLTRRGAALGQVIWMPLVTALSVALIFIGMFAVFNPQGFKMAIIDAYQYQSRKIKRDIAERTRIKGEQLETILDEYRFLRSDEIPFVHLWRGRGGNKYQGRFSALVDHSIDNEQLEQTPQLHAEQLGARMEELGYTVTIRPGVVSAHSCPGYNPRISYRLCKIQAESDSYKVSCAQVGWSIHVDDTMHCAIRYEVEIRAEPGD